MPISKFRMPSVRNPLALRAFFRGRFPSFGLASHWIGPGVSLSGVKLAVISDIHILGPMEMEAAAQAHSGIGHGLHPIRRKWRRGLHRVRRRLWNGHLEARVPAFRHAMARLLEYDPDWIIANGDLGGDYGGVGLSDDATFESVGVVVKMVRELFADKGLFVFGDHDLGKYSTALRGGGIRLHSLERGEKQLGIPSFWHKKDEDFHLIGVNSSLFTLDFFLPEALAHEIPEWQRLRAEHIERVSHAFDGLPKNARVVLFCHDPSALTALAQVPVVQKRMSHIELTVVGHLHSPSLLRLTKLAKLARRWKPKYPVARIIAQGLNGVDAWAQFNPVVCPSTFGTGHHVAGGLLFIERDRYGALVARRVNLPAPRRLKADFNKARTGGASRKV